MVLFYDPLRNGNDGFIKWEAATIEDVLTVMRKDNHPDVDGDPISVHSDQIIGEPGCRLRIVFATADDPFILIAAQ